MLILRIEPLSASAKTIVLPCAFERRDLIGVTKSSLPDIVYSNILVKCSVPKLAQN